MSERATTRPGGRSARVQQSVHQAVRDLEAELGREALTVPAIAARAGVTPSTVYRRWGDLRELLSDVAVERLRPERILLDHFDDAFPPASREEDTRPFYRMLSSRFPQIQAVKPKAGKPVRL